MRIRFTDTITFYHKEDEETWSRTVVHGIQWADRFEKNNEAGKISVARYASLTFPEGTFEGLELSAYNEEDAIVYGEVDDEVTAEKGHRLSDLLQKYKRSGRIQTVNDNSNRTHLKHIKVVVA